MGIRERRAREKEDLKQEILDAARDLFIRDGYESVSMRKIADRIEYSPTTIYLYFRDKSELFDCLSEQAFGKLLEKLQSIGGQESNGPMDRLRKRTLRLCGVRTGKSGSLSNHVYDRGCAGCGRASESPA